MYTRYHVDKEHVIVHDLVSVSIGTAQDTPCYSWICIQCHGIRSPNMDQSYHNVHVDTDTFVD